MRPLREYWVSLTLRERLLMSVGLGVVLGFIFFIVVIQPLTSSLEQTRLALARSQALYEWLRPRIETIQNLMKNDPQKTVIRLSTIEQSLRDYQLEPYLSRLAALDQDAIEAVLTQAPYQSVMRWLEQLEQDFGPIIRSVALNATSIPGTIDLQLTLSLS